MRRATGDLKRLLARWQRRLRLQDWDLDIQFARPGELDTEDASAEVHWQLKKRMATIKICAPECFPRNRSRGQDIEYSIVHELLHLTMIGFANHKEGSVEDTLQEQCIDQIARALVEAYRRKPVSA